MAVLRLSGKTPNEMFLPLPQRGFPSSSYDDAGARQRGARACMSAGLKMKSTTIEPTDRG